MWIHGALFSGNLQLPLQLADQVIPEQKQQNPAPIQPWRSILPQCMWPLEICCNKKTKNLIKSSAVLNSIHWFNLEYLDSLTCPGWIFVFQKLDESSCFIMNVTTEVPWVQQRKCEVVHPRHWQLQFVQVVVMLLQLPKRNPNPQTEVLQRVHLSSAASWLPAKILSEPCPDNQNQVKNQHNIGSLLNSAAKQSKAKISSKGWTFFLQNLRFQIWFSNWQVCVCVFFWLVFCMNQILEFSNWWEKGPRTFSKAVRSTAGSYGVEGITVSEYQAGLKYLRSPPAQQQQ